MKKKSMQELARLSCEEYHKVEKLHIVVVLDDVRSLNNIGSIFRTADAFLIEKIYLCGITATPPSPDIHKTALGAENSVEWEYVDNVVNLVENLQENGYQVCAIEQVNGSVNLLDFTVDKSAKYAVVLGNEVKGVKQEVVDKADCCIELPQYGTKHSLNVSITAGIVMWQLFSTMRWQVVVNIVWINIASCWHSAWCYVYNLFKVMSKCDNVSIRIYSSNYTPPISDIAINLNSFGVLILWSYAIYHQWLQVEIKFFGDALQFYNKFGLLARSQKVNVDGKFMLRAIETLVREDVAEVARPVATLGIDVGIFE